MIVTKKPDERDLRLVYDNLTFSFGELLNKDTLCTIQQRNVQTLAFEIFKTGNNLNPSFMKDIFVHKRDVGYE